MDNVKKVFFHFDLDAFFASVEQHEHPELKGKPVIIGKVGPRMVVSTCSYEARKYGVHSAMPSVQAYKLCPNGVFLDGNYSLYSSYSKRVMKILSEYGEVNQVSIDEGWMDMSGTELLFGKPKELAAKIKERIKTEIGITMSIGIAASPFIAKMASDYNKPDGLCMVSPGKEQLFIDAIGLKKIWGIGDAGYRILTEKNLCTPQQIRELSLEQLQKICGNSSGIFVYKAVRGQDPGVHSSDIKSHSISSETTFTEDVKDANTLHQVLLNMSMELMFRSLDEEIMAKTVGLKLRWGDFRTITVQQTPDFPVLNSDRIFTIAKQLLASKWTEGQGIRLIGLGLYQTYQGDTPIQDSLFSEAEHKKRELDKVARSLESKGFKIRKGV